MTSRSRFHLPGTTPSCHNNNNKNKPAFQSQTDHPQMLYAPMTLTLDPLGQSFQKSIIKRHADRCDQMP